MISDYRGDEKVKIFRADSCSMSFDKILLRCGRENLNCDKELQRRVKLELDGACIRILRAATRELSNLSRPVFVEVDDTKRIGDVAWYEYEGFKFTVETLRMRWDVKFIVRVAFEVTE